MQSLQTQQVRPCEVPDQERRVLPQETRSNTIGVLSGVVMNTQTRLHIKEIQRKLKSPTTQQNEFPNDNAVIEFAIKSLYENLKKQRLL